MITPLEWENWQEHNIFSHPLIKKWMFTWELQIKHQPHYALIMLVRGVSNLLMKNRKMIQTNIGKIDPRTALIYFSCSGSGKGLGMNFYQSIFSKTGLNIKSVGAPTPEKLIGSFDENIDAKNKQKGWTIGNAGYRDPVLHGYLELFDDIIFDEAEVFFNGKEYGDKILRTTRMALDPYGSQNNELQSETLKNRDGYKYFCSCNVMFLSYHINNISKQILSNGIFQRPTCFFYRISKEQMEDILTISSIDLSSQLKTKKQELVNDLNELNRFIESNENNITISKEANDYITQNIQKKLKDIYEDDDAGKLMQSFLPRQRENILKVAGALATIKKRTEIIKDDAHESIMLVIELGLGSLEQELIKFGVLAQEQQKWYYDMKRALGTGIRNKEDINNIMAIAWGISKTTVIKRIQKMEMVLKKVDIKGKTNTQFYRLR